MGDLAQRSKKEEQEGMELVQGTRECKLPRESDVRVSFWTRQYLVVILEGINPLRSVSI